MDFQKLFREFLQKLIDSLSEKNGILTSELFGVDSKSEEADEKLQR